MASSLSAQLGQIASATQTVALDRKKRSKLHSVSLVYEPKFAATQDYDSIYAAALEAFEDLENIDRRFSRFRNTIFNETSVDVDRLVQSKEQNQNLDSQVNAFLNLLSPYWDLSIAVKAVEWPLRRFQINVHNAEVFLLSALHFYNHSVFNKILHVIPQQNFPNIFQWLFNFKKLGKLPSQNVMAKAFTDLSFNDFYSKHLSEQLRYKNESTKQLIFYLGCTIASIAALQANDLAKLSELTPRILETSGELLKSPHQDSKITAYSVLAVLATNISLSKDVIFACIESILSTKLTRQGFASILKIYQTLQSFEVLPAAILLKLKPLESESELQEVMMKDARNKKFITCYIRSCIIEQSVSAELYQNVVCKFELTSQSSFKLILNDLLEHRDQARAANLLKWLIKIDQPLFLELLREFGTDLATLEMSLQTTLVDEEIADDGSVEQLPDDDVDMLQESDQAIEEVVASFTETATESFLVSNSVVNKEFKRLTSLFITAIAHGVYSNFNKSVFASPESSVSFLLRVSVSTNMPLTARLHAIVILRKRFREILKRKVSLSVVLPVVVALLADKRQSIRIGGTELLAVLKNHEQADFEQFFLGEQIYGPNSSKLASLPAKDIRALYEHLGEDPSVYRLDETAVYKKLNYLLEHDKKNNKLVYAVFVSHALVNNLPSVKLALLRVVIGARSTVKGVSLPSQLFEDLLKNYFDDRESWQFNCAEANVNFAVFEQTVVDLVSPKEKNHNGVDFLVKAVLSESEALSEVAAAKLQEVFAQLKFEFQLEVVSRVIESSSSVHPADVLQPLALSNEIFVQLLKRSVLTQTVEAGGAVKRRRRSSQTTRAAMKDSSVSRMASDHLKKITAILEVLAGAELRTVSFELLQRLINALNDLETLDNDGNLPVVYSQETLATCMLKVVEQLKAMPEVKSMMDHSSIRADSIVATIRSSASPQVQNKLLLVVAALAALTPETVLHSVMPIFTFMGAHTIRQDDEFSNHVVEQTVLCVVPALATAAENGPVEEAEFLTASFVSAFQHIPRHRRVKLFTTLARTLGVRYCVSLVLFLCGQQYSALYNKHKMADCKALLEFVASFLKNFGAADQLHGLLEYLKLWDLLPASQLDPDSKQYKRLISRSIFGVGILALSDVELATLKNNMVSFLDQAITSRSDLSTLPHLALRIASAALDSDATATVQINTAFGQLVQHLLAQLGADAAHTQANLYKLLGDVLDLLPIQQFTDAIVSVVSTSASDVKIKRHLTVLVGTKFDLESASDVHAQAAAAAVVPVLLQQVASKQDPEVSQVSLDALGVVLQKFSASLPPSCFTECLSTVVGDAGLRFADSPEVLISAVNCITTVVSIIGVKMIGFFPQVVPRAFEIFADAHRYTDSELVQVSVLVLFSCLMRKLPVFVLSSLKDILRAVLHAGSIAESTRLSVLDVAVQHLSAKDVLKSLLSLWPEVAQLDPAAIGLYLHTVELAVEKIDKKTAGAEAVGFFKFLLLGFEYRAHSSYDGNTVSRVEASLFQCGIAYVMKMNDRSFRPLFASMSRWAFDGEGAGAGISETERLQAFFRFFNKLQESLRSIVTSYYSYLLENVDRLLSRFAAGELADINLRRVVLISLTSSFKYDQDEFWASETRFDVVAKSLTDQLTNIEDGIGKYLVKAVSSVARNCASEDHNRTLNTLMMQHLALSCAPREKFWAARTMKMVYQKVGDQWLSLLPQLVPLIAELLEDDDEQVEHEVRSGLVKVIESVLGEPLDRYLS